VEGCWDQVTECGEGLTMTSEVRIKFNGKEHKEHVAGSKGELRNGKKRMH